MSEPGSIAGAEGVRRDHPFKINYSSILEDKDDENVEWLKEISGKFIWQNH